jgi:hypothetical protein
MITITQSEALEVLKTIIINEERLERADIEKFKLEHDVDEKDIKIEHNDLRFKAQIAIFLISKNLP